MKKKKQQMLGNGSPQFVGEFVEDNHQQPASRPALFMVYRNRDLIINDYLLQIHQQTGDFHQPAP